jgi:predicted 3-demethylubiquinone-9 3-methyltransferase (glyoxalase superfamily)
MKAGPLDSFNHSFSIAILVESQAEIDRIWEAFLANRGTPEACGWLKDRWDRRAGESVQRLNSQGGRMIEMRPPACR